MNEERILSMIKGVDREMSILGCTILGQGGRGTVEKFFTKYNDIHLYRMNDCILRIARDKMDDVYDILIFDDFRIYCCPTRVWISYNIGMSDIPTYADADILNIRIHYMTKI